MGCQVVHAHKEAVGAIVHRQDNLIARVQKEITRRVGRIGGVGGLHRIGRGLRRGSGWR